MINMIFCREVIDHIPGIRNITDDNNYNEHEEVPSLRERDDSIDSNTVTLEGYLWKKGKFLHLWSTRWYILNGNSMYYYDSDRKVGSLYGKVREV